jgi:hypothetical protein
MSDQSRRSFLRDLAALPVGATLGGAALTYREVRSSGQGQQAGPSSADFDEGTVTSMTTRLAGENIYETATASHKTSTRPSTITLVPVQQSSSTTVTSLQRYPGLRSFTTLSTVQSS